jgi:hypothetical protein
VDVACPTQDVAASVDGGSYPRFKLSKPFLPHSAVLTLKERSNFCSNVLCARSRFSALLKESIYNLGLVFEEEEGDGDFRKADPNGQLTILAKLSLQRWESGILAIHFLFPSEKQAINARMAEGPHYQATFHEFSLAMQKYHRSDIRFIFYAPNYNHSTITYLSSMGQLHTNISRQSLERRSRNESRSAALQSLLLKHFGRQLATTMPTMVFARHTIQIKKIASLVTRCRQLNPIQLSQRSLKRSSHSLLLLPTRDHCGGLIRTILP